MPGTSTGLIGTDDINLDGAPDFIVSGSGTYEWFEGPDFTTKHLIANRDQTAYSGRMADINGDGFKDFVGAYDANSNDPDILAVYLHPGSAAQATSPWQRIIVHNLDVFHQNDMVLYDLDGDMRRDIIIKSRQSGKRILVAFQNADINTWTLRFWPTTEPGSAEGIDVGDIDNDGAAEIVIGGVYLDSAGDWRTASTSWHTYDADFIDQAVKVAIGDLDGDGQRDDFVVSKAEAGNLIKIAAYSHNGNPAGGEGNWTEVLLKNNVTNYHGLVLADIDNDTDLDVVAGQAFQDQSVSIFYNGGNGQSWTESSASNAVGFYVVEPVDLDSDGDLDLIGPRKWQNSVAVLRNQFIEDGGPPTEPPPTPLNFTSSAQSYNSVFLTWTDTATESTYVLEQQQASGFETLATLPANATSYLHTGLTPLTTYTYRLIASNSVGASSPTGPLGVTTPDAPNLLDGVVGYWPLDADAGTVAVDLFGAHPATLLGGAMWQPNGGRFGGALALDGSVSVADAGPVDITTGEGLTVAAWVKLADLAQTEGRFVSKASGTSGNDHYWMLGQFTDGTALRFRLKTDESNTTATLISPTGQLAVGTWAHVAATYDGAVMRLYLNGVEVASLNKTGQVATNAAVSMALGGQPSGAGERSMDGLLDDVYLFDRALDPTELQSLMQAPSAPRQAVFALPFLGYVALLAILLGRVFRRGTGRELA